MKKSFAFSLALLALAIGFYCGVLFSRHFSDPIEHGLQIDQQTDRADVALRALKLTRAESTNTMASLETELDVSTVLLGGLLAETPARDRRQADLLMLEKIRDYRAKFPHKSEQPGVD